ncbi:MAG: hypothetical protein CVU94_00645 [Firmicutes bacterium HGW-Firmicutes-19]|jgi:hypothetical protein|nr:MAG: hypothetical protein CVU94_00645 [Firmicutes bacterium HGW-Firmicutes-19]
MAKIISTKGKQFRIAMDDGTFLDQPKKKHKTIFKVGDQVDVIQDGSVTHVMLKHPDKNRFTRFQKKLLNLLLIALAILMIPVMIIAFSPGDEIDTEPKIGEPLILDNVSFKVLEVMTSPKIGSGITVSPTGKFVVILLEISNNSDAAVFIDNGDFSLRQGEKSYNPSMNAPLVYPDKQYRALNETGINPGLSIKAVLIYDVPVDMADSKEFKLRIYGGPLGLSSGLIDLSNR